MTVSDQGDARVRVSDAERDAVVTTLRGHFETGRLTFDEFSDRVDEAYSARTAADLDRTLRELPRRQMVAAEGPAPSPARLRGGMHNRRIRAALSALALPNGICIGVWAAAGGGYFWPIWVLIPTGAVCLSSILAPDRHHRDGGRSEHGHGHGDASAPTEPFPPAQRSEAESAAAPRSGRVVMSVLFVDIVGSTRRAAALGDAAWHALLADYEREVATALQRHGGDTLFTKGDEVVAGFALPAAAVECAVDIRDRAKGLGLEVRAGVHAGEVDRLGNQANGIAMHIGRRVCEAAAPGQVLVSSTVHDLLAGSGLAFDAAGEQELKGLSGSWRLYQPQI